MMGIAVIFFPLLLLTLILYSNDHTRACDLKQSKKTEILKHNSLPSISRTLSVDNLLYFVYFERINSTLFVHLPIYFLVKFLSFITVVFELKTVCVCVCVCVCVRDRERRPRFSEITHKICLPCHSLSEEKKLVGGIFNACRPRSPSRVVVCEGKSAFSLYIYGFFFCVCV